MNFDLADAIGLLRRTPPVLRALVSDLPDAWLRSTEGSDTWSPFDVLGHLIDGEETDWIPRARIILARGPNPAFEPFDRLRHQRLNRETPVAALLERFAALRSENVSVLAGFRLTPRELALEGIHPELGRVTLRELLATWVAHDLGHIGQMVRVMAKQYGEAVGPWRRYLPVLSRG